MSVESQVCVLCHEELPTYLYDSQGRLYARQMAKYKDRLWVCGWCTGGIHGGTFEGKQVEQFRVDRQAFGSNSSLLVHSREELEELGKIQDELIRTASGFD